MDEIKRKRAATAALFERKGTAILGFPVKVKWLDNDQDMGYTIGDKKGGFVTVNVAWDFKPITDQIGLSEDERAMLRMGVFAHELLHQVLTDFKDTVKTVKTIQKEENGRIKANIFMQFANLLEDPAIEHQASDVFGGILLKALRFSIQTIYKSSPKIDESKDEFTQFLNALVEFGDMGIVKGNFTFPEARKYFLKVAPLFNEGIDEKNSKKRIEISKKCFEISKPLWEKILPDMDEESAMEELLKQLSAALDAKKQAGRNSSKNAEKATSEASSEATKAKRREETLKAIAEEEKSSSATGNDAEKEESSSATKTEDHDLKDDIPDSEFSVSEDDFEALKTLVAEEGRRIEKEKEPGNIDYVIEGSDLDKRASVKDLPARATENDAEEYSTVVSKNKIKIKRLERALTEIFDDDKEEEVRSQSGSLNVLRANTSSSARIFDKRRAPGRKKDAEVVLLVDMSGSMTGPKIQMAKETAIVFGEALMDLKIPHYIMGFTADVDDNGVRYDAYHTHFVNWEQSFNRAAHQSLCRIKALCDNYDSYAIRTAKALIDKRSATNKLIIVISDGEPAAIIYRSFRKGIDETAAALKEARKSANVLGIGIGDIDIPEMVQMYQKGFVHIKDENGLTNFLIKRITKIVKERFK